MQQLINGLTLGSIYGLIALGYSMVYGILGLINFAHGEIYMIGAFVALLVMSLLLQMGMTAVPVLLLSSLLIAILATAFYGKWLERIAYRRLQKSFRLAPLISAIGMSIFLQNAIMLLQGARARAIGDLWPGGFEWTRVMGGASVSLSYKQALIMGVTFLLLVLFGLVMTQSRFGRAQRAVAQDPMMARLLGVRAQKIIGLTFMIGAGLAAVAGFSVVLYYGVVDFYIGFMAGLKAFTAAVLGGIGSLPGAVLGGLIIGLIEAFWAGYAASEYKDIAVFVILLLTLTLRPYGLLGRPTVEKV